MALDPKQTENTSAQPDDLQLDDEAAAAAYKVAREQRKRQFASDEESRLANEPAARENELRDQESTRTEAAARKAAKQKNMDRLSSTGNIIAWVAAPLVLILFFYAQMKHATSNPNKVEARPDLPITGALVTVEEASSGWKTKAEEDKVSGVNELITKRLLYPTRLPSVTLKITAKDAYLRVLFLDSEGKIAGDPRLVKIEGGKVTPATVGSMAEKVLAPDTVQITGSAGFVNRNFLDDYLAGPRQRWSVEISESADYKAKGDAWKKLQIFAIANKEL